VIFATIAVDDIGHWFADALPWVWPSAALVVWFIATWLGLARWRRWIMARNADGSGRPLRLSPRLLTVIGRIGFVGLIALGLYLWSQLAPVSSDVRAWASTHAEPWIVATAVVIAILMTALYAARRLLLWLEARAAGTDGNLDDIIVDALSRPLYVSIVLLAINLWASMLPLPEAIQRYVARAGETTIIILIALFVDGLIQSWMLAREEHSKVLKTSGVVLRTAARILAFAIGGLMALSSLGFNVTPALATLGIGSAALGFALQGTVTDFLAGLMIAADQPVRVGDYIRIDDNNNQGWVLSIGWRTTRLLTRLDTEVIVPNSRLATSLFVNTSRPHEHCRALVLVYVSNRDDLDHMVAIATEIGESVQRDDPRAWPEYRSFAYIAEFHPGYVEMRTWICARNWDAHFGLKDAYLRRLSKRFRELGIAMANPTRTLDFQPDAVLKLAGRDGPTDAGQGRG
jgi:small-conductance mechanosensitive channel